MAEMGDPGGRGQGRGLDEPVGCQARALVRDTDREGRLVPGDRIRAMPWRGGSSARSRRVAGPEPGPAVRIGAEHRDLARGAAPVAVAVGGRRGLGEHGHRGSAHRRRRQSRGRGPRRPGAAQPPPRRPWPGPPIVASPSRARPAPRPAPAAPACWPRWRSVPGLTIVSETRFRS